MGYLRQAKTETEIRRLGVAKVREAYLDLASDYNKIVDGNWFYCHKCNGFYGSDAFYTDNRYASGFYPTCKKCLLAEATDYDKSTKEYTDNREKTIEVFRKLNLPFLESLYRSAIKTTTERLGEKNRSTAYQQMLVMVKSLEQYKRLTFKDSDFGDEGGGDEQQASSRKPRREIKKLFGSGFTDEEYLYLQDQYDDWCARTQVESKAQQLYVIRICFKLLDIWNTQKKGGDTTKLDESLNKLMEAAKLQPKQNIDMASNNTLTFSQMIEKWEEHDPILTPSDEFKDVDGIGKYLRTWFGWIAKAVGLNNVYTKEYEEEIAKYTVTKPTVDDEDSSADTYATLFGMDE